jgi:hypothetical protein
MLRKRLQRGEGQFGCLVGLVLLLIAGLVAYKMIPIKVKAAEMRDVVQDESRSAGTRSDRDISRAILGKAEQLGLPITEDNVKINRVANAITVEVSYTVPVQFPGFTYNWKFNHKEQNPIF